LPGDTLYGWKLASERIWYNLHQNPLDADIYLSSRRISEIQAVRGRANLEEIGVGAYSAILQQLSMDLAQDPEKAISVSELLDEQKEKLKEIIENSHADLPELDELFGIVVLPNHEGGPPTENTDSNGKLPLVITVDEEHSSTHGDGNSNNASSDTADEDSPKSNPQKAEHPN